MFAILLFPTLDLRNENEKLLAKAKDFDVCNTTISDLRSKNEILHAKVVELKSCKPSTSTVEHTSICTRCRANPLHLPLSTLRFVLDVEMLTLMLYMITWL